VDCCRSPSSLLLTTGRREEGDDWRGRRGGGEGGVWVGVRTEQNEWTPVLCQASIYLSVCYTVG